MAPEERPKFQSLLTGPGLLREDDPEPDRPLWNGRGLGSQGGQRAGNKPPPAPHPATEPAATEKR